MKKRLAIFLYVAYSVLLVLIITFASEIGYKLSTDIKSVILKNEIKDVVVSIDPSVPVSAKQN